LPRTPCSDATKGTEQAVLARGEAEGAGGCVFSKAVRGTKHRLFGFSYTPSELPDKFRDRARLMPKVGNGCTYKDAEVLAQYKGLRPDPAREKIPTTSLSTRRCPGPDWQVGNMNFLVGHVVLIQNLMDRLSLNCRILHRDCDA
jgi:hypothetical protein